MKNNSFIVTRINKHIVISMVKTPQGVFSAKKDNESCTSTYNKCLKYAALGSADAIKCDDLRSKCNKSSGKSSGKKSSNKSNKKIQYS
jgi:hypothetical protein